MGWSAGQRVGHHRGPSSPQKSDGRARASIRRHCRSLRHLTRQSQRSPGNLHSASWCGLFRPANYFFDFYVAEFAAICRAGGFAYGYDSTPISQAKPVPSSSNLPCILAASSGCPFNFSGCTD